MSSSTQPAAAPSFDDGAAYERFMGRWSRAVGSVFLEWVKAPAGASWLDVGCGTGAFTQLILDTCSPRSVTAVDPSVAQIGYALGQPMAQRAQFLTGDATALPFADASFDVVASALVINFVSDRPAAVREMHRAARTDAIVAGYVWDFAAQRSPSWPMRQALQEVGAAVVDAPGTAESTLEGLAALFEQAGLAQIATRSIEVTVSFTGFDVFWQAQTPSYSAITKTIAAMPDKVRARLVDAVRAALPMRADGTIEYSSRANAVKACAVNKSR
jgi:ubiquinone/menaquinone biosynthesis C-methylase UbiE